MTEISGCVTHDRLQFSATGHSGGDVCVAISILCYTMIAAIDGDTEFQLKPGDTRVECDDTPQNRKALEFVERGFRLLEEGYPDKVRVDICV